MLELCLLLCLCNTVCLAAGAAWLSEICRRHRKPAAISREDEQIEEERKRREAKLNEVFDYDPYGVDS